MEFMQLVIIPILISFVSVYVAFRLMPYDIQNKRADTISSLYDTVQKLVIDLETANKKIETLENRHELLIKTEMRIRLSENPIVEHATVEYVLEDERVIKE